MPVYFIRTDQIQGQRISIDGELSHHLRDVLRVRVGETLRLVDEQPKRYLASVVAVTRAGLTLAILEVEQPVARHEIILHLGIGLFKSEPMDWLLQKATELGVSRLSPLLTRRSVPLRHERSDHQHHRWVRIVTEASQQSSRWDIPTIDAPTDLGRFLLDRPVDAPPDDLKLILTEPEHPSTALADLLVQVRDARSSAQRITLLVGPSGGWEALEVQGAVEAGYRPGSLGPRALRSETAALAALAIVQYESEKWKMKAE